MSPRVVGVLLAAGAGRRYGRPKVLVGGWLDTAVAALCGGGCNDVVVVLGAVDVPAPPGATTVTAPDWAAGLSASLRTGLAQAARMRADYAVVHVIDTPDVGAAVITRVLAQALAAPSGLARAYFGDRPGHPVVLARPTWSDVLGTATGDRGAGPYLHNRDDVARVDCADLASGRDIDEP